MVPFSSSNGYASGVPNTQRAPKFNVGAASGGQGGSGPPDDNDSTGQPHTPRHPQYPHNSDPLVVAVMAMVVLVVVGLVVVSLPILAMVLDMLVAAVLVDMVLVVVVVQVAFPFPTLILLLARPVVLLPAVTDSVFPPSNGMASESLFVR
jgi:hypothetical protein